MCLHSHLITLHSTHSVRLGLLTRLESDKKKKSFEYIIECHIFSCQKQNCLFSSLREKIKKNSLEARGEDWLFSSSLISYVRECLKRSMILRTRTSHKRALCGFKIGQRISGKPSFHQQFGGWWTTWLRTSGACQSIIIHRYSDCPVCQNTFSCLLPRMETHFTSLVTSDELVRIYALELWWKAHHLQWLTELLIFSSLWLMELLVSERTSWARWRHKLLHHAWVCGITHTHPTPTGKVPCPGKSPTAVPCTHASSPHSCLKSLSP